MSAADARELDELLRQSAADFLGQQSTPAIPEQGFGAVPAFDVAQWREVAGLGWLGLGISEALGGPGLGLHEATLLAEQFGRFASPVPYVAASVLPAAVMACSHPDAQLVSLLCRGERPFALAWQEHARQIEDVVPQTRYAEGRISGTKHFVAAADDNSVLVVTAVDASGTPLLLAVAGDAPGVRLELHAAGLGREASVHFDAAPVRFEALATGIDASQALSHALQAGRIVLAAQLAGLAAGALDKTLHYVGGRVQFGKPISSFQAIRHRCVDLYIATRLASASWRHALRSFDAAPDAPATLAAISAAKARCGDVAVQVSKEAVQMHGAMGFTEEGGVGPFLRAAVHGRAWLGGSLAHRRRFMALHAAAAESAHG